ncbi:hypothetical protein PHYBLDRAFT_62607 [Phycomyces blakesleeanus NRRL 1555(-)]|uniref:Uncharacterized protein n=1 Tax=Phycomyces blakesleeanus (strain ATCC 8743b / DSM 1359 / FGSC 10004 / NBRC 33097 / NRRL 1555) TaxID=763407 RepID=A0A167PW27_PHYB8|nr:hypothetical protein PHYBLDRAFT_62607 [Phycomyces blakesleeanus NRRL 1555(-)]OAD78637.1 hypothetical protein PHYBLDRAFT_62607 [Phycomyces blakesleeanus NRRL 1555(-)]|eukprot:XP_018296677.1 hypothetical protein PHYBLDRAFT_62607 [Phycomyces blakesleeanus NRRL 1555(-)]
MTSGLLKKLPIKGVRVIKVSSCDNFKVKKKSLSTPSLCRTCQILSGSEKYDCLHSIVDKLIAPNGIRCLNRLLNTTASLNYIKLTAEPRNPLVYLEESGAPFIIKKKRKNATKRTWTISIVVQVFRAFYEAYRIIFKMARVIFFYDTVLYKNKYKEPIGHAEFCISLCNDKKTYNNTGIVSDINIENQHQVCNIGSSI